MRRLRRHNPEDLLEQMQNMFNEFSDAGMDLASGVTGMNNVPIDLTEEDGKLVLTADLPGLEKDEINVKADDEKIEISAERSHEVKEENEKYLRRERKARSFRRTVRWPKPIDAETINAEYEDGVLTVTAELEEGGGRDIEVE